MRFKRLMKIIYIKKTKGKKKNQSYNNNYLTRNISNKLCLVDHTPKPITIKLPLIKIYEIHLLLKCLYCT